jgi:hypothetical protein
MKTKALVLPLLILRDTPGNHPPAVHADQGPDSLLR